MKPVRSKTAAEQRFQDSRRQSAGKIRSRTANARGRLTILTLYLDIKANNEVPE
jgi:hypothetical protein